MNRLFYQRFIFWLWKLNRKTKVILSKTKVVCKKKGPELIKNQIFEKETKKKH